MSEGGLFFFIAKRQTRTTNLSDISAARGIWRPSNAIGRPRGKRDDKAYTKAEKREEKWAYTQSVSLLSHIQRPLQLSLFFCKVMTPIDCVYQGLIKVFLPFNFPQLPSVLPHVCPVLRGLLQGLGPVWAAVKESDENECEMQHFPALESRKRHENKKTERKRERRKKELSPWQSQQFNQLRSVCILLK